MLEVNEDEKVILDTNDILESVGNNLSKDDISIKADDNLISPEVSNVVSTNTIDNNVSESNCLALTVRKDYNLIIVKNIFTATGRLSWKIVLSTIVLNFLRMIF